MSAKMATGYEGPGVLDPKIENRRLSTVNDPHAADELLEGLGYKPELSRNRSTLQVAFMSFVLASIPYGLATTLYYPLVGGGPVNIIWGWVAVSLIIVCVASSLGEITSVYPTAGGNTTPRSHSARVMTTPLVWPVAVRCPTRVSQRPHS